MTFTRGSVTHLGGSTKSWRLIVIWWLDDTAAAIRQERADGVRYEHDTWTVLQGKIENMQKSEESSAPATRCLFSVERN